jgi:squalene-hopene/tetraprenyl-beta-curcumene cyclase
MKAAIIAACVLGGWPAASLLAQEPRSPAADSANWSGPAAAAYLDGRLSWWMSWPQAARDHETFCVSCHTVLPYAMVRPALRTALAEPAT